MLTKFFFNNEYYTNKLPETTEYPHDHVGKLTNQNYSFFIKEQL